MERREGNTPAGKISQHEYHKETHLQKGILQKPTYGDNV